MAVTRALNALTEHASGRGRRPCEPRCSALSRGLRRVFGRRRRGGHRGSCSRAGSRLALGARGSGCGPVRAGGRRRGAWPGADGAAARHPAPGRRRSAAHLWFAVAAKSDPEGQRIQAPARRGGHLRSAASRGARGGTRAAWHRSIRVHRELQGRAARGARSGLHRHHLRVQPAQRDARGDRGRGRRPRGDCRCGRGACAAQPRAREHLEARGGGRLPPRSARSGGPRGPERAGLAGTPRCPA